MRGRKPTPTALKLVRGNPGKRRLNQDEPKPRPLAPTRPGWLSPEAKREWSRLVPELERLGLLTVVDRAALAAHCTAWAYLVVAEKAIRTFGPAGPQWTVWKTAMSQVRAFAAEFGLTPSSRSRLTIRKADDDDEFESFLSDAEAK